MMIQSPNELVAEKDCCNTTNKVGTRRKYTSARGCDRTILRNTKLQLACRIGS